MRKIARAHVAIILAGLLASTLCACPPRTGSPSAIEPPPLPRAVERPLAKSAGVKRGIAPLEARSFLTVTRGGSDAEAVVFDQHGLQVRRFTVDGHPEVLGEPARLAGSSLVAVPMLREARRIAVYDTNDGSLVALLSIPRREKTVQGIASVAWAAGGSRLLVRTVAGWLFAADPVSGLIIWDAARAETAPAVSPDGGQVAFFFYGRVEVREARSGERVWGVQVPGVRALRAMDWSDAGIIWLADVRDKDRWRRVAVPVATRKPQPPVDVKGTTTGLGGFVPGSGLLWMPLGQDSIAYLPADSDDAGALRFYSQPQSVARRSDGRLLVITPTHSYAVDVGLSAPATTAGARLTHQALAKGGTGARPVGTSAEIELAAAQRSEDPIQLLALLGNSEVGERAQESLHSLVRRMTPDALASFCTLSKTARLFCGSWAERLSVSELLTALQSAKNEAARTALEAGLTRWLQSFLAGVHPSCPDGLKLIDHYADPSRQLRLVPMLGHACLKDARRRHRVELVDQAIARLGLISGDRSLTKLAKKEAKRLTKERPNIVADIEQAKREGRVALPDDLRGLVAEHADADAQVRKAILDKLRGKKLTELEPLLGHAADLSPDHSGSAVRCAAELVTHATDRPTSPHQLMEQLCARGDELVAQGRLLAGLLLHAAAHQSLGRHYEEHRKTGGHLAVGGSKLDQMAAELAAQELKAIPGKLKNHKLRVHDLRTRAAARHPQHAKALAEAAEQYYR